MKNVWLGCALAVISNVNAFEPLPITSETMSNSYNFLIHGDWGWNSFNQSLTAYEMGVYGWVVDAEFVIALGDNFYDDGTESTEDELWETVFHDVYTAPSLNIPWYGVLGNHDYHGNIDSQVDRSSESDETMWKMPSTYYTKHYEVPGGGIMTIVYIDTQLLDPYQPDTEDILQDKDWQDKRNSHLTWIIDELAVYSETSQWLFVAGHYPIISIGEHGDDQVLVNDLLHFLTKYKVHAYIAGHDHIHSHVYKDGLHHIISGNSAGRGPWGDNAVAYINTSLATGYVENYFTDCGFIIGSATASRVNFTFMNNLGNVKYVVSLDNPKNMDLIENSVVKQLKGFALPPRVVGTMILIPSLILVVSIILFLGKDFAVKVAGNCGEDTGSDAPRKRVQQLSSSAGQLRDKYTASSEMDDSMDSSQWSDIDASTTRLAPNRNRR